MASEYETVEDIVREMRIGDLCANDTTTSMVYINDFLAGYADRIEEAWKREREAGAEAAQICGEIGEMIGMEAACKEKATDCNRLGNAAKMREALSGLLEIVCIDCKSPYEIDGKCVKCPRVVAAEAALSSPPRNCDRFSNANDALEAFEKEAGETMIEFIRWLFAEAKGDTK